MIRRAQDGLRARVSGPWTREKLDCVGRYAAAFMRAMNPKRRAGIWSELVYVDLLAGPGRGIDRDRTAEFDGSPLRAVKIAPPFDRLFFIDVDKRNIEALRQRISPDDQSRVALYHLLFFSKDVAGLTIWRGIKKIEPGGQRTLF